jgi:DnaJ-domain-containing protein 1
MIRKRKSPEVIFILAYIRKPMKPSSHLALYDVPILCRRCDWPGCAEKGAYPAPKNRASLRSYYWFCLDHVRVYNAAWDFLAGMTPEEIESFVRESTVWERSTRKLGDARNASALLREILGDAPPASAGHNAKKKTLAPGEAEALRTLGLAEGASLSDIKARYRALAKRYHPDAGRAGGGEKIKEINRAFATLKKIREKEGKKERP